MNKAKAIILILLSVFVSVFISAQDSHEKLLYSTSMYGETYELYEIISDDNGCILCLIMQDNRPKGNNSNCYYDSKLQTVFFIYSDYITDKREYSKIVDECTNFFEGIMFILNLKDVKDVCDITPCCTLLEYTIGNLDNNEKFIDIEYSCTNLLEFFEIAREYALDDRIAAMEKVISLYSQGTSK